MEGAIRASSLTSKLRTKNARRGILARASWKARMSSDPWRETLR